MPEIAAVGLIGAIVTFLVVNWNLYWVHRSFQRPSFQTLNHNLSKVGRYWSLEQGRVIEVETGKTQEEIQKKDHQKATWSAFIFGTMMIFLSWIGLLIFAIYFVSITKLAKSRLEQRIFASSLVQDSNLSQSQIQSTLKELDQFDR
ncbi:MAG: hypothetical protein ACXWC9_00685 [Pseudobdellovibrionaceae bacterium]